MYSCSLTEKYTLIGSTVDTAVNSWICPGPTRFPIWAFAMPAMPSTGEAIRVNPRFSCAVSSCAFALSTAARVESSAPMLSSRSFWLTAFFAASGRTRCRFALAVSQRASAWAREPLAASTAAWKVRGSISKRTCPFRTSSPSR